MEENKTPIKRLPPKPIPPKKVEVKEEVVEVKEEVIEEIQEVAVETEEVKDNVQNEPKERKSSKSKSTKSKKGKKSSKTEAVAEVESENNEVEQESINEDTEKNEETLVYADENVDNTQEIDETSEVLDDTNEKDTEQNSEKHNKNKQKHSKSSKQKKKISKKKLIIIILAIVLVLAIGGGITATVLINQENNKKLATPVLTVDGPFSAGKTVAVLKTNKIDGATMYQFELTYLTDTTVEKTVKESSTNAVALEESFGLPGVWSVRARVLGKGPGATSEYSEATTFTNIHTLGTPSIDVKNLNKDGNAFITNENIEDDAIIWHVVPNTTKYLVRYGADLENLEPKSLVVEVVNEIPENADETEVVEVVSKNGVITFDLNNIYKNGTGNYRVSVIAMSTNQYYNNSKSEKTVTIEYYAVSTAPTNATFESTTNILTFELQKDGNFGNEFQIEIISSGNTTYHTFIINEQDIEEVSGSNIVRVSKDISGFNVLDNFTSMKIKTVKNNQHTTDSAFVVVDID